MLPGRRSSSRLGILPPVCPRASSKRSRHASEVGGRCSRRVQYGTIGKQLRCLGLSPGRLGGLLPQGSHRSGLAHFQGTRLVMSPVRNGTALSVDRKRRRKRVTLQVAQEWDAHVVCRPRPRRDSPGSCDGQASRIGNLGRMGWIPARAQSELRAIIPSSIRKPPAFRAWPNGRACVVEWP